MNATVTLGGLAVGIVLHVREFGPGIWAAAMKKAGKSGPPTAKGDGDAEAKGKFDIKAHVPYLLGDAIGMLAITCPGGFIGKGAEKILGISNSIGNKALSSGVGGEQVAAAQHAAHTLDQYGSMVVLILVASLFLLRKALPKPQRKQLAAGCWSGATVGLSAGAAGIAGAVLVPLAQQIGHALGGQL